MVTREVLITKALSLYLQGTCVGIVRAYEELSFIKQQVLENRVNIHAFHMRIYNAVLSITGSVGAHESMLRVYLGRQSN